MNTTPTDRPARPAAAHRRPDGQESIPADPVAAAAAFIAAQPGGIARVLEGHRAGQDGRTCHCGARWPCLAAHAAERARQLCGSGADERADA